METFESYTRARLHRIEYFKRGLFIISLWVPVRQIMYNNSVSGQTYMYNPGGMTM